MNVNSRIYIPVMVALVVWLRGAPAGADPPLNPLPPPLYSFDLQSPSVQAGLVSASAVLALAQPHPVEVVPGPALGLTSPADDLDALSRIVTLSDREPFALLFSVDRASQGLAEPDPMFALTGIPFNATDQAARGHAAGDEFVALVQYTGGGARGGRVRLPNNVLVRNNYDEGGEDFAAQPPTSAQDDLRPAGEDNVDAIVGPAGQRDRQPALYFSTTRESPSNLTLPGFQSPSGANVFFNPDPNGGAETILYAPFYELGLQQFDDVDSLIVFDLNSNPLSFGPGDRVLFSLTPDSPSLPLLPGGSLPAPAAHVFLKVFGQPLTVFALATDWGLGGPSDNIDALDLALCPNVLECAMNWGIQAKRGDLNCDNEVGFGDINAFVLALSNPAAYETLYPSCPWANRDINRDQSFDFGDINPFVALLSGGARSAGP